jgi:uncharacterized iron-regulated protein
MRPSSRWFISPALLMSVSLSACQSQPESGETALSSLVQPTVEHLKVTPSLDPLIPELLRKQVVLIGENHDRYEHHLVQLEIIRRLHAVHPELVIGVEFFQRPFQPYLDAFIAGDLDEGQLLKKTEYFQRWGFDYRLYRPIMDYARDHKIPVIALNVSTEMLRRVAETGLQGLSAEERAQIPRQIDQSDSAYRERLREIYRRHGRGDDEEAFERFWQAQLLWDETMAETAVAYLQAHPGRPMVILAGSGHLLYGAGIPRCLTRRLPVATAVVINAVEPNPDRSLADYLLVPERIKLPPPGQLGIVMDRGPLGVLIQQVQTGSGAQEAGLREGAQIIKLDDQPVADPEDIRIGLLAKRPGEMVSLTVIRAQASGENQESTLNVRLGTFIPGKP